MRDTQQKPRLDAVIDGVFIGLLSILVIFAMMVLFFGGAQ